MLIFTIPLCQHDVSQTFAAAKLGNDKNTNNKVVHRRSCCSDIPDKCVFMIHR